MFVDSTAGVWKRAVSGLHAMEDPGGSPAVAPPMEPNPVFERVADAAVAGLQTYADVLTARVTIGGTEQRPQAQIECMLAPSGNLARVAELIDSSLVGQIEMLLGEEFSAVDVRIHHSAVPPAE